MAEENEDEGMNEIHFIDGAPYMQDIGFGCFAQLQAPTSEHRVAWVNWKKGDEEDTRTQKWERGSFRPPGVADIRELKITKLSDNGFYAVDTANAQMNIYHYWDGRGGWTEVVKCGNCSPCKSTPNDPWACEHRSCHSHPIITFK